MGVVGELARIDGEHIGVPGKRSVGATITLSFFGSAPVVSGTNSVAVARGGYGRSPKLPVGGRSVI